MVDRSLETAAQMSRFAIASAAFRIRHAMRFGNEKQTGVVDSIGSCSRAEVTSHTCWLLILPWPHSGQWTPASAGTAWSGDLPIVCHSRGGGDPLALAQATDGEDWQLRSENVPESSRKPAHRPRSCRLTLEPSHR